MIIRDGVTSVAAGVDDESRLLTFSVIEEEDRHINKHNGKVWSADMDGVAINAGAYVAWFQNTSSVNYHMTDMRVHCLDAVSIIDMDIVTVSTIGNATAFAPTDVASRNLGVSDDPSGSMHYASSVTGLTGLTKVANLFHAGSLDNKTSHLKTSSNIIIPPSGALAVKVITANASLGIVATWSLVEVSS